MTEWIQDKLPELKLALGYHHSWRSGLVFVFHEILGRTQAELYATEYHEEMWWVLRDASIGEKESLDSMWGWLPLNELPDKPFRLAAWQTEKPRPPEWIEKLKRK